MAHRFVNRTHQPLMLPSKRGGRKCFRPGEGTTDNWYSRFVGDGMLTREAADGAPVSAARPRPAVRTNTNRKVRDSTVRVPPLRIEDPGPPGMPRGKGAKRAPAELLQTGCQVQCEHATQAITPVEHWVTVGAIHYCRYCDFFTPDGKQIRGHAKAYHGLQMDKPTPPAAVKEVVDSHENTGVHRVTDEERQKVAEEIEFAEDPKIALLLGADEEDLREAVGDERFEELAEEPGAGPDDADEEKSIENAPQAPTELPEPTGVPVEDLGLPKKAQKALVAGGIKYVHQINRMTDEALLSVKGIGPAMAKKIRAAAMKKQVE